MTAGSLPTLPDTPTHPHHTLIHTRARSLCPAAPPPRSGRVIRAVYNGEVVAAKEVEVGRAVESQEAFLTEAQRMQALRHPQLVAFYGVCLDGPIGILLLELCEGGRVQGLRGAGGVVRCAAVVVGTLSW